MSFDAAVNILIDVTVIWRSLKPNIIFSGYFKSIQLSYLVQCSRMHLFYYLGDQRCFLACFKVIKVIKVKLSFFSSMLAFADFEKKGKKDTCPPLEQFLCHIAKTGQPM